MTTSEDKKNSKTDFPGFSPDRPIESAAEDLLGRSSFADLLAQKIGDWRGHESLVIALYGGWGSGKSSVKNLIVKKLQGQRDRPVNVVDFNPWLVSGEEKITHTFFSEVGRSLSLDIDDKESARRAATWQKYARYCEIGSKVSGAVPGISWMGAILSGVKSILEGRGEDLIAIETLRIAEPKLYEIPPNDGN